MKNKVRDNRFLNGNQFDEKHYWLSPDSIYEFIERTYLISRQELFDPCPYPRPEGFNGLEIDWEGSSYVNQPFGVLRENGKRVGATAWWRKAKEENLKGKWVFLVFPVHGWLLDAMMFCGASVHNLGSVKWLATEDGSPAKGSNPIALFVLKGKPEHHPRFNTRKQIDLFRRDFAIIDEMRDHLEFQLEKWKNDIGLIYDFIERDMYVDPGYSNPNEFAKSTQEKFIVPFALRTMKHELLATIEFEFHKKEEKENLTEATNETE
ncbi:hypothetical protein [Leptospira phage LE3]|uniref:Uncharacterized protein n=1 Tax=Leptospira phage LE3 TaxID=2041382 RepID=A0A343LE91_9CAUD|nr:hypothetical protein HWB33_gp76 [Leptospira phage LE3]ATN95001.1 hypothetical protein [Leptospira phage LE3]